MCVSLRWGTMMYIKGHILGSSSVHQYFQNIPSSEEYFLRPQTRTPLSEAFRINRILIHLEQKG